MALKIIDENEEEYKRFKELEKDLEAILKKSHLPKGCYLVAVVNEEETKMKSYRVWTSNTTIDIEAKTFTFVRDELPKIVFVDTMNRAIAEFYCNAIAGWAELDAIGDIEPKYIVKLPYMVDTDMAKALANSVFGNATSPIV